MASLRCREGCAIGAKLGNSMSHLRTSDGDLFGRTLASRQVTILSHRCQPSCNFHTILTDLLRFFIYDFWHSFHLGLGKTWLASVLALISDRMGSSNIEGRFAELTDLYLQWCDEQHETPYLTAISKEMIGWIDRQKYPNGFLVQRPYHCGLVEICGTLAEDAFK